jgi:hypothetical protein
VRYHHAARTAHSSQGSRPSERWTQPGGRAVFGPAAQTPTSGGEGTSEGVFSVDGSVNERSSQMFLLERIGRLTAEPGMAGDAHRRARVGRDAGGRCRSPYFKLHGAGQTVWFKNVAPSRSTARLQCAGLIRYSGGRMTILDSDGLQAAVCDCAGVGL